MGTSPGGGKLIRIARARLACLALALRAEDADAREGWCGGPNADRDDIAHILRLE